jgi:protein-S-isoprenylcysteine O-methyltransferase Ste14
MNQSISSPNAPGRWQPVLDGIERLAVLTLFTYFVWRLMPAGHNAPSLVNILLMVSEGLVLILFLIRRPATLLSMRRSDWMLAMAGTLLPMSVQPASSPSGFMPQVVSLFLMICGLMIQIHAKYSLGRSMGMVAANRGVKQSGPYQFVRHPMYAGYFLTQVGFFLVYPTAWNLAVYAATASVQIFRLLAEERLLAQTTDYRDYMYSVRFRLVPGLF